jgi:hypothetical protein
MGKDVRHSSLEAVLDELAEREARQAQEQAERERAASAGPE